MLRWAYAVTTVPERKGELFPRTLASLKAAGFDRPRLFVDGLRDPREYDAFGLETVARHPRIRTFGNWILGLGELFIRDPMADRFAMFQDDFITYAGLREYLEKCKYPANGYLNLYTFPSNQQLARGEGWYLSNQFGRGAVALVFDRNAVLALLTHSHMIERPLNAHKGHKSVDGGVVTAMQKAMGCKDVEWVHNPSLVQHTGLKSAMGNRPHKLAESFRGEGYDVRELIRG